MEQTVFYAERQSVNQTWVWLLLAIVNAVLLGAVVYSVLMPDAREQSTSGLMIAAVLMLLVTLLCYAVRLDTELSDDGVRYRYIPFHRAWRVISWESVTECYVRTYSPIGDYGGWGLRWGLSGRGNAVNVSGNHGLQLVYGNGKKLLIGTQQPELLTNVLIEHTLRMQKHSTDS